MNVEYGNTLDATAKKRYIEKLQYINGEDPYCTPKDKWTTDPEILPHIQYPDIYNYLITTTSAYTHEDLKSYKGLDAYNQFVCGWVADVCCRDVNTYKVVIAKVRHSQSVAKTPLSPWVIVEKDGCVISGHCTCMAGLGEACTHVAALLFMVDAAVRIRSGKTVTDKKAYWLLPTGIKTVNMERVTNMNFKSAKTMKKHIDCAISETPIREQVPTKLPTTSASTPDELTSLFTTLHLRGTDAGILSIVPGFSQYYLPKSLTINYPQLFTELRNETCIGMELHDLLPHCETVFASLKVSSQQSELVEENTRDQAASRSWHRFRTGRVTASRIKAVCHTNTRTPAKSLIKAICYPTTCKFSNKATRWGCQHERDALKAYQQASEKQHDGFSIKPCGFIISTEMPFLGASPDSLVDCSCCGFGVVEVKCPFCVAEELDLEKIKCLELVNGSYQLRKNHAYHYQTQTQIFVANAEYCDFVIWTKNGVYIERIEPDHHLWEDICTKSTHFFKLAILPELLGKYYSRAPHTATSVQSTTSLQSSASTSLQSPTTLQSPSALQSPIILQPPTTLHLPSSSQTPTSEQSMANVHCSLSLQLPTTSHGDTETSTPNQDDPPMFSDDELFCMCQTVYDETEKYIGCDNNECKYKWCHYKCVGIKRAPRGDWFCFDCRSLPQFKPPKKRKNQCT